MSINITYHMLIDYHELIVPSVVVSFTLFTLMDCLFKSLFLIVFFTFCVGESKVHAETNLNINIIYIVHM